MFIEAKVTTLKIFGVTTMTLLSLVCVDANASMRCDNGIASEGDSAQMVLQKCGAPASREQLATVEDKHSGNRREYISVEQWMYGPKGGMYQYLKFEGGKLVQIKSQR